MKNRWKIISAILTLALFGLVGNIIVSKDSGNSNDVSTIKSQTILENITTRKSVRRYSEQTIPQSMIDDILRAGMAAPTAGNKQPWAFVVINNKETLSKLGAALPYAKMTAKAPLAIIVCGNLSKAFKGIEAEYWVQDGSAATQNILLAAHGLGLGAVWTGVYPVQERIDKVSEIINLPDSIIPLCVIPIGYPEGETKVKDKWKPENIRYNKW